jgi:hypothetical protein
MKFELKNGSFLKIGTFFFCIAWLIIVNSLNKTPLDAGDGLMHFNISQASWSDPILFLSHWGKPLFILLSSPFAQFGLGGVVLFNILLFGLTVGVAWKIMKHFSVLIVFQCLFPLVLLSAFDYTNNVLAGLTEPLFGFCTLLALWFLISNRWTWFAVVVSFMPFMRSEGQLAVVLGLLVLLGTKQFKNILFLGLGFLLYSGVGYFAFHDFMWYFTMSPYQPENDIYGHGNWYDYLLAYKMYLGNIGLLVFLFGTFRLFYLFYTKQWKEIQFPVLFFSYGLFFGILISHSYFWAKGMNGSCGLTRIATQAMPAFVLINLLYLGRIPFLPSAAKILQLIVGISCVLLGVKLLRSPHFPRVIDSLDQQVLNAAHFLESEKGKGHKFFFHHPLFVHEMGGNPCLKNQPYELYYCSGLKGELGTRIKPGDYLIRDSHFGPQESKFTLEELASAPEVVKIKEFISDFQTEDRYNEVEGVTIYQYQPKEKKK